MAILLKLWAMISAVLFSLGLSQFSVVGYTDGEPIIPEKTEYCFDNEGLIIGGYYGDKDHVKEAAEAGIDFFVTNMVDDEFLDKCAEYGIGVIASGYNALPTGYGDLTESQRDAWMNFDYSNYRDHEALWGDDLIDEPSARTFDRINDALRVYYDNTDGKIGYVNLFPQYANDEQLGTDPTVDKLSEFWLATTDSGTHAGSSYKAYISEYINKIDVDYICMDFYPYRSRLDLSGKEVKSTVDSWIRNLDILAEACRETGRDMWVITQACGETEHGEKDGNHPRYCDEVSDISQQAYACLAFGTKAIIHAEFSARGWWAPESSHMINSQGGTTATYDAVKTVDGYLDAFADVYGDYVYESTFMVNPLRVAGRSGGALAVTKPSAAIDVLSLNGMLVGTFNKKSGDGKAYVFANMEELNKDKSATFTFFVPHGATAKVYDKGNVTDYGSGAVTLTLEPGGGVFVEVSGGSLYSAC